MQLYWRFFQKYPNFLIVFSLSFSQKTQEIQYLFIFIFALFANSRCNLIFALCFLSSTLVFHFVLFLNSSLEIRVTNFKR